MIGIFLDDERFPEDVKWVQYPDDTMWIIVRSYWHFIDEIKIAVLENKEFFVTFDHDLMCFNEDREYTGMDCLKWLIEYCLDKDKTIPQCYFHTKNLIGEKNMRDYYNFCLVHLGG